MFILFHTTKMNDNILYEVVRNNQGLPRYVSVRAPRTVNSLDGGDLTYASMQRVLLERVISAVRNVHPRWSREYILRQVTGNVFLL